MINRMVWPIQQNPSQPLMYVRLDKDSLQINVYAHSSFANNENNSSQVGYIILITDKTKRCNILHYLSHKSRQVTRSVLGGALYVYADALDMSYVIEKDLEAIFRQQIPMTMRTDPKIVFDVITKFTSTSKKRLTLDTSFMRESYDRQEIYHVGYVRSQFNPADAFTKLMKSTPLTRTIQDNTCNLPIVQWAIRQ